MKFVWKGDVLTVSKYLQNIKSSIYKEDKGTMVVGITDVEVFLPFLRKKIKKNIFEEWTKVAKERGFGEIIFQKIDEYGIKKHIKTIEVQKGFSTYRELIKGVNLTQALIRGKKIDLIEGFHFSYTQFDDYIVILHFTNNIKVIEIKYESGKFYFDWNGEKRIPFDNYEGCIKKLADGVNTEIEKCRLRQILG